MMKRCSATTFAPFRRLSFASLLVILVACSSLSNCLGQEANPQEQAKIIRTIREATNAKIKVALIATPVAIDLTSESTDEIENVLKKGQVSCFYFQNGTFAFELTKRLRETKAQGAIPKDFKLKAEHIELSDCDFDPAGVQSLMELMVARTLIISHCRFDDLSDQNFGGKPEPEFFNQPYHAVETLALNGCYLGEGRVKWSHNFPNVQNLSLNRVGIGDRDLLEIQKLSGLRELAVRGNNFTDSSIPRLKELTTVKQVQIRGLHRNLISADWVAANAPSGNLPLADWERKPKK